MSGAGGLTLEIAPRENEAPVVLRVADDPGATPVRVRPAVVPIWTHAPGAYDDLLDGALLLREPGRRRVRLYCPAASAAQARLTVHGGTARYLGRRTAPLLETLTWVQAQQRRLPLFHDRPEAVVVEQTRFFDADGREVDPPAYLPEEGLFRHRLPVTGALVVEYRPGFSLYEIEYDTGADQISPEWFREMRRAWLAGNIADAAVPPVRVIAVSGDRAAQVSFPRAFWPNRSTVRGGYAGETAEPRLEPDGEGYRIEAESWADPCWRQCREMVKPDGKMLSDAELQAVRDCVERSRHPTYHYVETERTVRVERIHSPDDAEVYVDVERPVRLVMKHQRSDGGPCAAPDPDPCCPELVFRFKSDS